MIHFGIDVLAQQQFERLKGKRVGLIVNPTSVDAGFEHLIDLIHRSPGVTLGAIFGPEHGVRGEAQYMEPVEDVLRDPRTGVPMYSLYGHTFESLTPKREWLAGLDALLFDIQDVGSRYYTYVYTMALAMRAAAQAKVEFHVLDRPNPIGLTAVEGNLVREGFRSFVGLYALPNRHGLTAGELAQLLNTEEEIGVELQVTKVRGLRREMRWAETGRGFVPPSPNMPTVDTALVYPGLCLLEGTNISEGRGTCRPFEQFGAPYLKSHQVAQELNAMRLPGVHFRPCGFTPTFDKWKGQSCEGAFIHVTDAQTFRPLRTGVAIVAVCRKQAQEHFAWREDAYEFVEDIPAFDLLCGTDAVRLGIERGDSVEKVLGGFEMEVASFEPLRQRYALY